MTSTFRDALNEASVATFGNPMQVFFEGRNHSIPCHDAREIPTMQIWTGTHVGPGGNAHGPDEKFDHIPATKAVTTCLAAAIASPMLDDTFGNT